MNKKNSLVVDKTATYFTLGNIKTAKTIWFVLHGYGYLAEFFIKKFEPITNNETCVIAPEALSHFYLDGFYGKVGASWMTKHNREDEIVDYINYLQKLYDFVLSENNKNCTKINVVGFSQGGATACRWFSAKKFTCTNFILWASVFPDDVEFNLAQSETKLFLIYGTQDEFLTEERMSRLKKQILESKVACKVITFDGKHGIPKDVLIEESVKNVWN
ncbi:MAG: dienelactone hydrolase family protein [Flavobacteriales bacterium]|nr:dienelactone hydrolase family protein [Flavobacteriales bacterium]MCB9173228.1 dienelactone hydrolase family protein [Flavobacteriales bacterium]